MGLIEQAYVESVMQYLKEIKPAGLLQYNICVAVFSRTISLKSIVITEKIQADKNQTNKAK
jgi:hypothetical protein